ncbi:alpha/beta hydrolase [Streptomyces sp. CAU 1734]|uniref:alpha/beta hydrolase n=1 Tax=Streptomyces sp. CAU 1734 TaxID=3140360 RepID=UPI003260A5B4
MRRCKRTLVAAALAAGMITGTAGWASGNAQQPVTGAPPGAAEWRADRSLGRALPDPERARPADIAAFFRTIGAGERDRLARRHPLIVGNLDGAPAALRYRANALAVRGTPFARLAEPGRRILAFDPRGRGQVAQVYGDLERARRVAVIVPGADIDAGTFDRRNNRRGTLAGMAESLRAATGDRTAVIAWAGYTTPVGIGPDAAGGTLAEAGAVRLARFTRGLTATGKAAPALFCHSYGSVVCGLAAKKADASEIVALGSPGMRADSAADLGTSARVWAARHPSDWISKVPNVELLGLGHGNDPADPAFGARRVPTGGAGGHTGYFAPGSESLRVFAAIAAGDAK